MTLHKSIEAAREEMPDRISIWRGRMSGDLYVGAEKGCTNYVREDLATLPAKPMTEYELYMLVLNSYSICGASFVDIDSDTVEKTIRALRNAGVLYVEDWK